MFYDIEIINHTMRATKELTLSVSAVEKRLRHFGYEGENKPIDEQVENAFLPPWVKTFYALVFEDNIIPSPEDFVQRYFEDYEFEELPNNLTELTYRGKSSVYKIDSVVYRLLRSYPSIVRDFHFLLMAVESDYFEAVKYSFRDDYYGKIDIKVKYNDVWYNVGLLLDSKRSHAYKMKKEFRHEKVDVIYIPLNRNSCQMCGDYWLYKPSHVMQLLKIIQS